MKDLQIEILPELDWSSGDVTESLSKIFRHAADSGISVISWYRNGRQNARRLSIVFRSAGIILGVIGTTLPAVTPVLAIPPVFTTTFLALAAAFIALDRYFGSTETWTRRVKVEAKIRALLESFQMAWQMQKAKLAGDAPNAEEIQQLLHLAHEFLLRLNAVIAEETDTWIATLSSSTREIEKIEKIETHIAGTQIAGKVNRPNEMT
jgi:hypothetical protein